jgi:hypothetical protein
MTDATLDIGPSRSGLAGAIENPPAIAAEGLLRKGWSPVPVPRSP